jgi:hypothetical protein
MASHANNVPESTYLTATVVEYEDEPDQCTIHPVNVPDERRMEEWISAKEGSFFIVEELR